MHLPIPGLGRIRRFACALLAAATLASTGCAGAYYGATTGAYFAAAGTTCNTDQSYGVSGSSSGNDAEIFLLGAVVVGATIGAIIEIFKWAAEGCSNW